MLRATFIILGAFIVALSGDSRSAPALLSVCELSNDFSSYRDKVVAVRGVYYYGLRQDCKKKCTEGPWPSFLNLQGTGDWQALSKVADHVESEAKAGKRFEIWVTAVGHLRTNARHSQPCDPKLRGFGHLGAYPAQLDVDVFRDIEVKVNPKSIYDYANMYRGPL